MKKIIKSLLFLGLSFSLFLGIVNNNAKVKAYDSIDASGTTTWTKSSEEIKTKYGLYYSHMIGRPTTGSTEGSEKNVNYFSMKTDGTTSKLVTWIMPQGNSGFVTQKLTELAKDYEAKHPGWIVLAGINADQWYYQTNAIGQKGGYFFFHNQTYYPLTVDGQNLFTINPLGASSKGIGITNNANNPFIDITGSTSIEIQLYDENDNLVGAYPVDGYNQNAQNGQTMVWSGHVNHNLLGQFSTKKAESTNDLYIIEDADLAYMNNSRDFNYDGTIYSPVDSFYGRGTISKIDKSITLGKGQFAIETTNSELLAKLSVGLKVIVEQQYSPQEANNVESVTGYHTVQVKNGEYKDSNAEYNKTSKPRSIFGVNEDGSYFLMTTRNIARNASGTVHTETNAILSYYNAYTAYQDDGGGSVTAIYRNEFDGFDLVSDSSDGGTEGSQRNICTGLFFVVRDSGFASLEQNATTTSVKLTKKNNDYAKDITDAKLTINGKEYLCENDAIQINDLEEGKEYVGTMTYKYLGTDCSSIVYVKTKEYEAGLNFEALSHGFKVTKVDNDDTYKTLSATINIEGKSYELTSDFLEIKGLDLDKKYTINYSYVYENTKTKETYTKQSIDYTYKTLAYEIPQILNFVVTQTGSRLRVEYEIEDNGDRIKEKYLLFNDERKDLNDTMGIVTYNNLDFDNNQYRIKLVVVYQKSFKEDGTLESEELTFGKAECVHDWEEATYDHPKRCKKCGITEGEPLKKEKSCKSCKKDAILNMISLSFVFGSAIIIFRRRK